MTRRVFHFNGFRFDVASRQVTDAAGQPIVLTRAEYELLRVFVSNPGAVMDRDRLIMAITHRQDGTNTRTIDVLVQRLRTKFGDDPKAPRFIETVRGAGYRMRKPGEERWD